MSIAADSLPGSVPTGADIVIGDQTIHYLWAGSGPTLVLLIHGWPQSAHEWRHVIPLLSDRYTVVAPDLRGIGGSSSPSGALEAGAFDKATLACDVHALVEALRPSLGFVRVVVAGHDIGGMVAYAYARLYPQEVAGVAIMDIPIPGLAPWDDIKAMPMTWHFNFHMPKDLAETLVRGHQAVYFRTFFFDGLAVHPETITDEDVTEYAEAYGSPESLRAMCELYRAFPKDVAFNTARTERLDVPLLLVGGETTLAGILPTLAKSLTGVGASDVRTAVIAGSGHWLGEEQPERTAAVIADLAEDRRADGYQLTPIGD